MSLHTRDVVWSLGVNLTVGVPVIVAGLANELSYVELIGVIRMIAEECGDSVFIELLKRLVSELEQD